MLNEIKWTEFPETKTKEITTTNRNKGKYFKEPMKNQIKTGKQSEALEIKWTSRDWFTFWIWLIEKVAKVFWTNHRAEKS